MRLYWLQKYSILFNRLFSPYSDMRRKGMTLTSRKIVEDYEAGKDLCKDAAVTVGSLSETGKAETIVTRTARREGNHLNVRVTVH
jgi:hypothetical protein